MFKVSMVTECYRPT